MKILFVHRYFPAQFGALASVLADDPAWSVAAIGSDDAEDRPGIAFYRYRVGAFDPRATHAFARHFDLECRRAEQILYAASELTISGFVPDIVVVHPGWGEALALRSIFPLARVVVYCEYFYRSEGGDVGYDPADPPVNSGFRAALWARNAASLLALAECDAAWAPTQWQRATFPPEFHGKIAVCHEGVDTKLVAPRPDATWELATGKVLSREDEVVTFVARDLEPLRGYLAFMRALPSVLRARPNAQVVIVGGDGTSYGAAPPEGTTWKDLGLRAVEAELDLARVHFVGRLPYEAYVRLLQVSSIHVYLSYPFVLSWSLIEAMSAGCAIVASDTGPCREVIDGSTGVLVDPFDAHQVNDAICALLSDRGRAAELGTAARKRALLRYRRSDRLAELRRIVTGDGVDTSGIG